MRYPHVMEETRGSSCIAAPKYFNHSNVLCLSSFCSGPAAPYNNRASWTEDAENVDKEENRPVVVLSKPFAVSKYANLSARRAYVQAHVVDSVGVDLDRP